MLLFYFSVWALTRFCCFAPGVFVWRGLHQPLSAAGEGKAQQWYEDAAGAPGASVSAFVSAPPPDHGQTEGMVGRHVQPYIQPSSVSVTPVQNFQDF